MAKAKLYIKNGNSWVNYNLLNAYPVGAIYASANSTSPASLFGGSWTQITDAAHSIVQRSFNCYMWQRTS